MTGRIAGSEALARPYLSLGDETRSQAALHGPLMARNFNANALSTGAYPGNFAATRPLNALIVRYVSDTRHGSCQAVTARLP